jgi:hypothetical protein
MSQLQTALLIAAPFFVLAGICLALLLRWQRKERKMADLNLAVALDIIEAQKAVNRRPSIAAEIIRIQRHEMG